MERVWKVERRFDMLRSRVGALEYGCNSALHGRIEGLNVGVISFATRF